MRRRRARTRWGEYDPAIVGKDQEPEPADLVVCTDVLEHIEPDYLDEVLLHLRTKVKKRLFFAISLRPAGKTLADGRNAHLIVESAEWWLDRLSPYFRVFHSLDIGRRELAGIARPVSIVGAIKSVGVMKDERNDHTRRNVLKTATRIPDQPVPPHERVALDRLLWPVVADELAVTAAATQETQRDAGLGVGRARLPAQAHRHARHACRVPSAAA